MKLINLTTQTLAVYREDDVLNGSLVDRDVQPLVVIPPAETPARAKFYVDIGPDVVVNEVQVPVVSLSPTVVHGLPRPKPGVYYIVTNTVRNRLPERQDLLVIGRKVFSGGRVIGCTSLYLYSQE